MAASLTVVGAIVIGVVLVAVNQPVVALFPWLWLGVKAIGGIAVMLVVVLFVAMVPGYLARRAVEVLPGWEKRRALDWSESKP